MVCPESPWEDFSDYSVTQRCPYGLCSALQSCVLEGRGDFPHVFVGFFGSFTLSDKSN